MGRRTITRRDFLNGTRIALTGAALSPWAELFGRPAPGLAAEKLASYYPPAATGLRGSHDGSWEVAHALVAGKRWKLSGRDSGERYDLIVVGGGLSGLAAAHFYRKTRPEARILVLDNHDDFGGHAKRNEFQADGRLRIGYGGTQSIDSPSSYSSAGKELLRELGIDVDRFYAAYDQKLYESLGTTSGIFFGRETFGVDRLVAGYDKIPWKEFAARTPLNEKARADLVRLHTEKRDYLPGLSRQAKAAALKKISYRDFLLEYTKVDAQLIAMYQGWWLTYTGLGLDSTPAYWVAQYPFLPGLAGTLIEGSRFDEPYIFHFPDGNASIARLLVRSLIPAAVPGRTMEDVVTAKVDYALLDVPASPVRLRLNSTAIDVRHATDGGPVEVAYVRGEEVQSVRGSHCVLACYNGVIPYICSELPERQKQALAYAVKTPMVYVNVLIRSWRAFVKQGVHRISAPGFFYTSVALDFPVSLGRYQHSKSPDEPILLHLVHVPYHPEIKGADQWRAGQRDLLTTSFATFEAKIRDQLKRMLEPGGFDADANILAITVNRWPHGYAYEPNSLWDPDWASEEEKPWVIGRRSHGRIAIANSDAGASAYTQTAIDQAQRAVRELLGERAPS